MRRRSGWSPLSPGTGLDWCILLGDTTRRAYRAIGLARRRNGSPAGLFLARQLPPGHLPLYLSLTTIKPLTNTNSVLNLLLLLSIDGTDRTDRQTDARPCSTCYAGSVNNQGADVRDGGFRGGRCAVNADVRGSKCPGTWPGSGQLAGLSDRNAVTADCFFVSVSLLDGVQMGLETYSAAFPHVRSASLHFFHHWTAGNKFVHWCRSWTEPTEQLYTIFW